MDKEISKALKKAIRLATKKDPLEGSENLVKSALEVMPLTKVYDAIHESGTYSLSRTAFSAWVDKHGLRSKKKATPEATEARRQGRLKANGTKKARAAKEIPAPPELPQCPNCGGQLQAKTNDKKQNYWQCQNCWTSYSEELDQVYVKKADGSRDWMPLDGQGTSDPASLNEQASSRPASPAAGPDTSASGTGTVVANVASDDDFQEV